MISISYDSSAIMLRRAPTSISLSNRDVAEHFEHLEQKKLQELGKNGSKEGHRILSDQAMCELRDLLPAQSDENDGNSVNIYEYGRVNQQRALQGNAPPFVPRRQFIEDRSLEGIPLDGLNPTTLSIDPCSDSEIDENLDLIRPFDSPGNDEELPVGMREDSSQQSSQTPRGTFGHGGTVDVNVDSSTSFLPQDMSTPGNNELPGVQSVRSRFPLPRSPLYRAQSANSPERNLTTSLTPRIASHGTPGLLLPQAARRPRNYRPRSLSYSFEESERTSAACEQSEGSDNDSISSRIDSEPDRNLREEMDAGSLQNAYEQRNLASSRAESVEIPGPRTAQETSTADKSQVAHSSSPQLPLPPPFSAVRRDVSLAASLPSVHRDMRQSRSPTPLYDLTPPQASPVVGSATSSGGEEDSERASGGVLSGLAALPLRLLSVYRSRSPFQTRFDGSGSGRASPSTPKSHSQGSEGIQATSTRSCHFQIYDDNMPATTQPQTPQHLPEARHQSRFHPSYTAPASGRMDSPRANRSEVSRRRGTRSDSPTGLETPGFQGLYGGRENIDDNIMFDRASQRLWTWSSTRRRGRWSMNSTPDQEPSLADIREGIR